MARGVCLSPLQAHDGPLGEVARGVDFRVREVARRAISIN